MAKTCEIRTSSPNPRKCAISILPHGPYILEYGYEFQADQAEARARHRSHVGRAKDEVRRLLAGVPDRAELIVLPVRAARGVYRRTSMPLVN